MPRAIKLTEEEKKKFLDRCHQLWQEASSDWSPWMSMLPTWQDMYRCIVPEKTEPWPGCSNLMPPIVPMAVERTHSTYVGVLDQEELLRIIPTEGSDVQSALSATIFMNHAYATEMRMWGKLDRLAHKTLMNGMQHGIMRWKRETEFEKPTFPVPKSALGRSKNAVAIASHHFQGQELTIYPAGKGRAKVNYLEDGRRRTATVTILRDDERYDPRDDEIEYEVARLVVVKDCPWFDIPSPEDLLCSGEAVDPREARHWFYNLWYTFEELESAERTHHYDIPADIWEQIDKADQSRGGGSSNEHLYSASRAAQEADSGVRTTSAMQRDKILVQKVFTWLEGGNDALERVIASILYLPSGGVHLLRLDPFAAIFPTREWPIVTSVYEYLDDGPSAIGIPQKQAALAAEIATLHNQIVDANSVRNSPVGYFNSGSNLTPGTIRTKPGQLIGVPATAGLMFPSYGSSSGSDVMTLNMLLGMSQELVPGSAMVNAGGNPVGNRTSGGLAQMIQQNQQQWDKYVKRYGMAIGDSGRISMQLYAAFMPPWKEFRVAGSDILHKQKREDLQQQFDFEVTASMLTANKEVQQSYSALLYQMLSKDPTMQSPELQWGLKEDLLKSMGKKDIERIIGPRPALADHPHYSPETEGIYFCEGINYRPHADDPHEEHIAFHMHDAATNPAAQLPGVQAIYRQHIEEHRQMLGVQKRAAMQQAMGVPQNELTPGSMGQAGGMLPVLNGAQRAPQDVLDAQGSGSLPPGMMGPPPGVGPGYGG